MINEEYMETCIRYPCKKGMTKILMRSREKAIKRKKERNRERKRERERERENVGEKDELKQILSS